MKVFGLLILLFGLAIANARVDDVDVEELPEGVKSVSGKVTVFADFRRPHKAGSIPLYIINRTDKVLELPYQDGDVYLKLETKGKAEDGKWKRVQPHAYSW